MSIEAAIIEWTNERPAWQRALIRRLARGERLGLDDHGQIADALCADGKPAERELAAADLAASTGSRPQVALVSVGNLVGINALVPDQNLSFGERGLTIVYGDNGCGKSGYARLIKNMVRARHRDQAILPNVFVPPTGASAAIEFWVGGDKHHAAWPTTDNPDLLSVRFFDEGCSEAYVTKEADATYRPAALHLFEALVRALDGVRTILDARASELQAPSRSVPRLQDGTPAAAFVAGLTEQTSTLAIDAACASRANIDAEIQRLRVEEGRLLATDPDKERSRLAKLASDLSTVSAHITSCEQGANEAVEARLRSHWPMRPAAPEFR